VEAEPCDVPPQDSLRLVKLPNILGVEPRPFDPDTFGAGAQVEIDARGFKRVRLRDQNCIRWRWAADEATGGQVQESNARFVRWSDGSLQLLLGDEVLDVKEIDTTWVLPACLLPARRRLPSARLPGSKHSAAQCRAAAPPAAALVGAGSCSCATRNACLLYPVCLPHPPAPMCPICPAAATSTPTCMRGCPA
jgi:RNA polymerase-associated protein LEO1